MWQEGSSTCAACTATTATKRSGPQILDQSLWEKTGHWDWYRENMFVTESEKRDYALKPMNCPGHIIIFKQGIKSYRDLPLRFGEFGSATRNEPTGGLHGIMRVRAFTQDDGHIFCTEDQIQSEVVAFTKLLRRSTRILASPTSSTSSRPARKAHRHGRKAGIVRKAHWPKACALRPEFEYLPGKAPSTAPRSNTRSRGCLGTPVAVRHDPGGPQPARASGCRICGGRRRTPPSHHAPPLPFWAAWSASSEFLIEQHSGALPTWLAPVQVSVLNITDSRRLLSLKLQQNCKKRCPIKTRVALDLRNERLRIKYASIRCKAAPYILVAGDKEEAAGAVAVRARGNRDLGVMSVDAFIELIAKDIADKA